MTKNYYDILGVKEEEKKLSGESFNKLIKKKWKSLSKKYHPDKYYTKSKEEQDEAEEKFKEVSEAYEILSDENKRREYDLFGTVGNHHNTNRDVDIDEMVRQMKESMRFREQMHVQKGRTIKTKVNVTLEEIYKQSEISIKYNRHVPCEKCNGTGSKDGKVATCPHCNGIGRVRQQFGNPYQGGISFFETTCPYCQGEGQIISEPCHKCGGTGTEIKIEELKLKIPQGCCDGVYTVLEGAGDVVPNGNGINGDLVIYFHVVESPNYTIDPNNPYDVIKNVELPILDCITGCDCEIIGLNGKKYKIKIQPNTLHNTKLRMGGLGLVDSYGNNGDMYVCIKSKMPKQPLTESEKKLINELKQSQNFK